MWYNSLQTRVMGRGQPLLRMSLTNVAQL